MWELIIVFCFSIIGIIFWCNKDLESKNTTLYSNMAYVFWIFAILVLLYYVFNIQNGGEFVKSYMCGCKHIVEY
jgi:hypothetical protein